MHRFTEYQAFRAALVRSPGKIRTCNQLINSQLLYLIELQENVSYTSLLNSETN